MQPITPIMPDNSNNPFNFWEELKRRKVIRVVVMYAGAAYVITELITNISEPLHFPEWTATLVIIILIFGFPVVAILSWIFDLTPEGLKKTETFDTSAEEILPQPVRRKLKATDVIITFLIMAVVFLAYPKVIKRGGSLKAMSNSITFIDENGVEIKKQVPKEKYIDKLAIFGFQPEEADTLHAWLSCGIPEGVYADLLQFPLILGYSSIGSESLPRQEQIKTAEANNCPYYLTGIYSSENGIYNITSMLHRTSNGSVVSEHSYQGKDVLSILDSISLQIRLDFGTSKNILNEIKDLPVKEYLTNNPEAYKQYIFGRYYGSFSNNSNISLVKALELDSSFAAASLLYAYYCNFFDISSKSAKEYIEHTIRYQGRLLEIHKFQARSLYYAIHGDKESEVKYAEFLHESEPYNIKLLEGLIYTYFANSLHDEAEEKIKALNKLLPDSPLYHIWMAYNYLLTNKIDKGLKYINKRIKENTANEGYLKVKGLLLLEKDDLDGAEKVFNELKFISAELEVDRFVMLDHINFLRGKNYVRDELQKFAGTYRTEFAEQNVDYSVHHGGLMEKAPTQWVLKYYPVSDTSFTGLFLMDQLTFNYNISFHRNTEGEIDRVIFLGTRRSNVAWKQDSLILNAEMLLKTGKSQLALVAFQQAYSENPEHYYLVNYIQHLNYVLSPEYLKDEAILDSYLGTYEDIEFYKENNMYFFRSDRSGAFRILPLAVDQFMNPSKYNSLLTITKDGNQIKGLRMISREGYERFRERNN